MWGGECVRVCFDDGEVGVFCLAWCSVVVKRVHVCIFCTFANEKVPVKSVAYWYEE